MRKILSLMLVLCLALAAFPAAAEDLAGEWNLLILGLQAGTGTFNADGTLHMVMDIEESSESDGTWVLEGDTLTLTFDGQSQVLTRVEDQFVNDAMYMTLSREPAKITYNMFVDYTTNGTLPENVTAEEMTAALQAIMTIMIASGSESSDPVVDGSASVADEAAPAADESVQSAPAEGDVNSSLIVTEESFVARENYSGDPDYYLFLVVHNNSESPLYINKASATLQDAEGNEIGSAKYLYGSASRYLEPQETSVVSLRFEMNGSAAPDRYSYTVESKVPESWNKPDHEIPVRTADLAVDLKEAGSYENILQAKIELVNPDETPVSDPRTAVVLRSEDGKILDLYTHSLYNLAIGADSSIILTLPFGSPVQDFCIKNGLTPAGVEVYAWYEEP